MTQRLSKTEARRLILHSQGLYEEQSSGGDSAATALVLKRLGYIQIDTLAVIARAHNHTLWNRNRRFNAEHIDELQRASALYEYWAHALAYLPIENFRYSLPMMQRIAAGEKHWYKRDLKLMVEVEERIRSEGPLSARDFTDQRASKEMWARSPSKNALEQLFMEGKLMIPYREGFAKVYDLTERVLPDGLDLREPSEAEQQRFLIMQYLKANGMGTAQEISYLRKGVAPKIKRQLQLLEEDEQLIEVEMSDTKYFAIPQQLNYASKQLPRRIKILSPFDNCIIQRKRLSEVFDFDYQLECYVKKENRRYGYFCLPLLWGSQFIGRMDCKALRKSSVFQIIHLHLEDHIVMSATLKNAIKIEFSRFAKFNACNSLQLINISAPGLSKAQQKELKTAIRSAGQPL